MKVRDIISYLSSIAPPSLQEPYDNAGLLTGDADWNCSGIICSLDATEDVIREAIDKGCNLIVAHHPIIFSGQKKLNGRNYVEKAIILAIKQDIAIYAIHTNFDNVIDGVSGRMATELGLTNLQVLSPKRGQLRKLYTFVPTEKADEVRNALFAAGAGSIGSYRECSFNTEGTGTFTPGANTNPWVGERNKPHREPEQKIELIFPAWLTDTLVSALRASHPYEEPAFDIIALENAHRGIGSGVVGELPQTLSVPAFIDLLKTRFQVPVVRHSRPLGSIKRVALCGGAGSFLISNALAAGVDAYVTADLKYHEFFDANDRLLLADIGHFESEQFTIDLLQSLLAKKFLTFAVLKTGVKTNPVHYS